MGEQKSRGCEPIMRPLVASSTIIVSKITNQVFCFGSTVAGGGEERLRQVPKDT